MANFEPIVEWLLYQEDDHKIPGKIVDLGDGAGLTRLGITQKNFGSVMPANFWTAAMGFQAAVSNAKWLYEQQFWHHLNADRINNDETAAILMSAAVNEGISTAVRLIQRILGVDDDGVLGLVTVTELNQKDPTIVNRMLRASWVGFYQHLAAVNPSKQKFLAQWLVRAAFPFPSPLVGSLYGS